jgi:hypothetical protein
MQVRRGQNRDRFKKNQGRAPSLCMRFWRKEPFLPYLRQLFPQVIGLIA